MICPWADLKISDNEALEILRVVSQGSRLDMPDRSHAIVNGIYPLLDIWSCLLLITVSKEIFHDNPKESLNV